MTGLFVTTRSIIGADSLANTTLTDNAVIIKQNIPSEELIYWSPVSYYEYETQLNESKKNIKLINLNMFNKEKIIYHC